MSAMPKLESFHPDIANNEDDLEYKIDIYNYDVSRICGYNYKGELLDVGPDIVFPSNLGEVREPCEPHEECENDMDFDPALFCPDIIMELGDTPIITTDKDEVTTDDNSNNEEPIISITPIYGTKTAEGSFDLTPEENEFRMKTYGTSHPVQYSRIHCTACNDHLGSALSEGSNIMVHPLLKVIICKGCYDFYTSGEFEKDYDGSETYCRWCGQGGLVICCSNCEFVFCTRCIRNNFGRKVLARIRDSDEWTCFKCDHSQLIRLRVQCAELIEYVRREIVRASALGNSTAFFDTDYSKCCKYTTTETNKQSKKVKRKYSDDDQDYNPDAEQPSPPSSSSSSIESVSSICNEANTALVPKPVTIVPKPVNTTKSMGIITQGCQNSTTPGVANSTNRTKVAFVSHPKPLVNKASQPRTASDVHGLPKDSSQVKVLSNGRKITIIKPRNFVPSTAGPRQTPIRKSAFQPDGNSEQLRKKMCYETTVRAASRINSDLSYNLLKLKEEKMNARKLDDFVMVHNKLQEALNGSINSLIQLRKTFTVADLSRSSVQKPLKQSSVPRQLHLNPDLVSNFFKTTPSTAWKNFNAVYAANCEKATVIGIKEQKEMEDTTNLHFKANAINCSKSGSAAQNRAAAPVLIISDSETSINSEGK